MPSYVSDSICIELLNVMLFMLIFRMDDSGDGEVDVKGISIGNRVLF